MTPFFKAPSKKESFKGLLFSRTQIIEFFEGLIFKDSGLPLAANHKLRLAQEALPGEAATRRPYRRQRHTRIPERTGDGAA